MAELGPRAHDLRLLVVLHYCLDGSESMAGLGFAPGNMVPSFAIPMIMSICDMFLCELDHVQIILN